MVYVTDGAHVYVGFAAIELLLCHYFPLLFQAHNRIRTDDLILTKNALYRLSYVGKLVNINNRLYRNYPARV